MFIRSFLSILLLSLCVMPANAALPPQPLQELTAEKAKQMPPPPSDLVKLETDKGLVLRWNPVGLEAIKYYQLYRVTLGGKSIPLIQVPASLAGEQNHQPMTATLPQEKIQSNFAVAAVNVYGVESQHTGENDGMDDDSGE